MFAGHMVARRGVQLFAFCHIAASDFGDHGSRPDVVPRGGTEAILCHRGVPSHAWVISAVHSAWGTW